VEELGGVMEWGTLFSVLSSSCSDWVTQERAIMKKLLEAMGEFRWVSGHVGNGVAWPDHNRTTVLV